jgi:crotonobetainyl-CoA:carnitine CoA-transferase CaiB-like acyl-CoA transferase
MSNCPVRLCLVAAERNCFPRWAVTRRSMLKTLDRATFGSRTTREWAAAAAPLGVVTRAGKAYPENVAKDALTNPGQRKHTDPRRSTIHISRDPILNTARWKLASTPNCFNFSRTFAADIDSSPARGAWTWFKAAAEF